MNCDRITAWRKSSYSSGANSMCVEVAGLVSGFDIRDSKNPSSGVLRLAEPGWQAFLSTVRARS